jgi:hypothetical protein
MTSTRVASPSTLLEPCSGLCLPAFRPMTLTRCLGHLCDRNEHRHWANGDDALPGFDAAFGETCVFMNIHAGHICRNWFFSLSRRHRIPNLSFRYLDRAIRGVGRCPSPKMSARVLIIAVVSSTARPHRRALPQQGASGRETTAVAAATLPRRFPAEIARLRSAPVYGPGSIG